MTDHDDSATPLGDADLVLRTRSGDRDAFGELWRRHYRSGLTVARSVTSSLDPDDLVQEAYTRIYQAIIAGGGPTGSFRAYLFTSIRNTAAGWGRARRETTIDELDTVEDPATTEQATEEALDRSLTHQAFRSLPTRWQEVLWYSEIEQMKPAEIAPLLGLKATAVAQLTFRAREGLREAWIQAHLRSVEEGSDCAWTIERLGAHARGNLGRRDSGKIDGHLAECTRCTIVACEAKEVSGRLALVLLPLTVGVGGAAAYLATLQGGGVPIVALAAGAGAGAGSSVGAGAGAGSSAGAGAAGGSGLAAAGAGGILSGVGAVAGLVTVGVVVVGAVVAAAVVLPAINSPTAVAESTVESPILTPSDEEDVRDAAAPTSSPSPSDLPVIATPMPSTSPTPTAPVIADVKAAPATPPAPIGPAAQLTPGAGSTSAPSPTPTASPTATPSPTPTPTSTPMPTPTSTPAPTPTATPMPTPDPEPTLPTGSPTVASSSWRFDGTTQLTFTVALSAAAGSTVQALLDGDDVSTAVADEGGQAVITFRASIWQLADAVQFRYLAGEVAGPATTVRLFDLFAAS